MLAQWLKNVRVGVSVILLVSFLRPSNGLPEFQSPGSYSRWEAGENVERQKGKCQGKCVVKTYHVTMGNCVESLPKLGDYDAELNNYASLCSLLNLRMIAYPTFKKISK